MDDSTGTIAETKATKPDARIPFGMISFSRKQREHFGQNIRLAMACIEGTEEQPANTKAMPLDEATIRQRLKGLSQEITSQHADLLELLVRFDDVKGWKSNGACHCAAWMNADIGIGLQLSWEYLRAGRALRSLPTTQALFRAGKLTWSKIRLITRVANPDNEKLLCHAALDATVTDVQRLCSEYRFKDNDNGEDNDEGDNERALRQWESRALRWNETSNGSTSIQLILPPALAQAFLNSVEHSLKQLEASESTMSQRRADAAVSMAESSLQSAGRDFATADRYQVIVSVNATELGVSEAQKNHIPSKRPTIKGAGPVARDTARRIACDCCLTINGTTDGEPTSIGTKSRVWPPAMARAIKDRDQHCQFPGCTHTQNLQIHHIKHWADGGETSVQNSACLCSFHHTLLHEGGYSIQRVADDEQLLNEQFTRQQNAQDTSQFAFEKSLRDDKNSFDNVRKLSPTRYRFRVLDANGQDVRDGHVVCDGQGVCDKQDARDEQNVRDEQDVSLTNDLSRSLTAHDHSTRVDKDQEINANQCSNTRTHSTRVGCAESYTGRYNAGRYDYKNDKAHNKPPAFLHTTEQRSHYLPNSINRFPPGAHC